MTKREKLTHMKVVRLRQSEYQAIETTAEKFNFTESELIRRSIRIGLPILDRRRCRADDLALAGSPSEESDGPQAT
jgi:hypothetical protein